MQPANLRSGALKVVGKPAKVKSPRACLLCGTRGHCNDSINYEAYVRRRYHCVCGHRWSTYEVIVDSSDEASYENIFETLEAAANEQ